jgi:arsenate reductase (glutaredoxin)
LLAGIKMYQIYHNPRCRISRQVLASLQKTGKEIVVIEYLKETPSVADLKVVLMKLNLRPQQIIRTHEKIFRQKFKEKKFTDTEWLQILYENPLLIERPIVIKNNKAIVCRPPEKVEEII